MSCPGPPKWGSQQQQNLLQLVTEKSFSSKGSIGSSVFRRARRSGARKPSHTAEQGSHDCRTGHTQTWHSPWWTLEWGFLSLLPPQSQMPPSSPSPEPGFAVMPISSCCLTPKSADVHLPRADQSSAWCCPFQVVGLRGIVCVYFSGLASN